MFVLVIKNKFPKSKSIHLFTVCSEDLKHEHNENEFSDAPLGNLRVGLPYLGITVGTKAYFRKKLSHSRYCIVACFIKLSLMN